MIRRAAVILVATALAAAAGCTQRRIEITSTPPGARVTLNDVQLGLTPLEVDFTYYGTYDVRLSKDGYEPLVTKAEAAAPFYEWPGIDLVALVVPVEKKTIIKWHFDLQPAQDDPAGVLERARVLREELGPPPETKPKNDAAPAPAEAPSPEPSRP